MTKEEKDLLLKDLCARLPYGVIVETQLVNAPIAKYPVLKVLQSHMLCDFMQTIENVIHKPYLFPMSSMTEEQKAELSMLVVGVGDIFKSFLIEVEFYHKHHIDYRGLIPMGLAIDATGLNLYGETKREK